MKPTFYLLTSCLLCSAALHVGVGWYAVRSWKAESPGDSAASRFDVTLSNPAFSGHDSVAPSRPEPDNDSQSNPDVSSASSAHEPTEAVSRAPDASHDDKADAAATNESTATSSTASASTPENPEPRLPIPPEPASPSPMARPTPAPHMPQRAKPSQPDPDHQPTEARPVRESPAQATVAAPIDPKPSEAQTPDETDSPPPANATSTPVHTERVETPPSAEESRSVPRNERQSKESPDHPGMQRASASYKATVLARIAAHRKYPALARRMKQQGNVIVRFTLNDKGEVSSIALESASAHKLLNQAPRQLLQSLSPFDEPPHAPFEITLTFSYRLQ